MLRQTNEAMMAIATVLFFIGMAEFFATNTGFSMLSLSNRYAAATTDTERSILLAAGEAMLTIFNENAFLLSYVLVSISWTMISVGMFRSTTFSRINSTAGILAGSSGLLAVLLEHTTPASYLFIAISFYFAAIVFLFIWMILTGRRILIYRKNITIK